MEKSSRRGGIGVGTPDRIITHNPTLSANRRRTCTVGERRNGLVLLCRDGLVSGEMTGTLEHRGSNRVRFISLFLELQPLLAPGS